MPSLIQPGDPLPALRASAVTRALAVIEDQHHRDPRGFDQPPVLYGLFRHHTKPRGPLAARPIPVVYTTGRDPLEALTSFADALTSPEAAYALANAAAWHLWAGYAYVAQVYGLDPGEHTDPEQFAAAQTALLAGQIHAQPGRIECRLLIAATKPNPGEDDPRLWTIARPQGEDHATVQEEAALLDPDPEYGPLYLALRSLTMNTAAFAGRVTASAVYTGPVQNLGHGKFAE